MSSNAAVHCHPGTGPGRQSDRAGERGLRLERAWTDPPDMNQHVQELHALLAGDRAGGRYVLIGHSYGGRITRVYAKTYPRCGWNGAD